ncbi:hypothetical protein Hdeb2414_s0002g00054501 [Helianthus debilis subsp. tardiflorus]
MSVSIVLDIDDAKKERIYGLGLTSVAPIDGSDNPVAILINLLAPLIKNNENLQGFLEFFFRHSPFGDQNHTNATYHRQRPLTDFIYRSRVIQCPTDYDNDKSSAAMAACLILILAI